MTFPGAVPRTFIGAVLLAGFSGPVMWLNRAIDRQHLG
jgi:alpha-1,6-mannosyltransferase